MQKIKMLLETLKNGTGTFYLSGGTALAMFYFQHRTSEDLDFFSRRFRADSIKKMLERLENLTGQKPKLSDENNEPGQAKMQVFQISLKSGETIKIDFVEDFLDLLKPLNNFNGIPLLSLEDIYLRKIFAVSGALPTPDLTGRTKTIGGRQEAKDLFDLYFLSSTFMPLSAFMKRYGSPVQIEGLVYWFRTFDRLSMKGGLADLKTTIKPQWRQIEKHLAAEIDRILETEINTNG